jgi:hypothetical protein
MKKHDAPEVVAVDGVEYRWQVRHTWVVKEGVGEKGISVSVSLKPERTRELILDFPFLLFGVDQMPKRAALIAAVQSAIEAAMAAGWDPESRGRPFRFNVPGPPETP